MGAVVFTDCEPRGTYRGNPALSWQNAEPSLEDVFIEMMGHSQDNYQ